ncbi:hypothetical protein AGLY_008458 [Aphis glycines]|uniref:Uncharacterized protein n=1 Tax=Aphis glycines TaxID=307491 RepID=A0A6G0TK23_APHGL|nr:hypothetical protein AGLY_008458 [Aphis glycines]
MFGGGVKRYHISMLHKETNIINSVKRIVMRKIIRVCLSFDNHLLRQPVQLSTMYAHYHTSQILTTVRKWQIYKNNNDSKVIISLSRSRTALEYYKTLKGYDVLRSAYHKCLVHRIINYYCLQNLWYNHKQYCNLNLLFKLQIIDFFSFPKFFFSTPFIFKASAFFFLSGKNLEFICLTKNIIFNIITVNFSSICWSMEEPSFFVIRSSYFCNIVLCVEARSFKFSFRLLMLFAHDTIINCDCVYPDICSIVSDFYLLVYFLMLLIIFLKKKHSRHVNSI